MSRFTRIILLIAGVVAVVTVLQCMGMGGPRIDILGHLAVGWWSFLARVGPHIRPRWDLLASAVVYLVVFVIGAHFFIRWIWRETRGPTTPWRFRWTCTAFAVVILMFAAGTAAVGIVHQVYWLATSPEPLYGGSRVHRARCQANLRSIGQVLQMYTKDHAGLYPDDFGPLLGDYLDASGFVCPSSNDELATGATTRAVADELLKPGHCSYLYFAKGLCDPLPPDQVLVVEPLENHDHQGINVLYADGRAEWLPAAQAEPLLLKLGFERVPPSPKPPSPITPLTTD